MIADSEKRFTYVTHSGFGHQLQALLRALFIAHASRVPLLVPPLMTHHGSLEINGQKGCVGQRQLWEYHTKKGLMIRAVKQINATCRAEGDSFFQLFNLTGYPVVDGGCGTVHARSPLWDGRAPCDTVHDTATVALPPLGGSGVWGCDNPRPCLEMIERVRRHAGPLMCLGPLNEYFVRGMLANCSEHRCGLPSGGRMDVRCALLVFSRPLLLLAPSLTLH